MSERPPGYGGRIVNERTAAGGRLLKATVLSVSLVTMMNNSISAVLGDVQEAFPGTGTVEIQCLLTIPTLTVTLFILIGGVLVNFMGNRRILLSGLFIYTVCGIAPIAAGNYRQLLVSRLGLGLGLGLIFPLALGLITDFYEGKERISVMGQQFAVGNLGQTFALAAVGLLSVFSWRYSFLVYSLGGAVFVLVLLFLPEPYKKGKKKREKSAVAVNRAAVCVMALMGFYNMVYITMYSNLSLVMKSNHIGTAVTAGSAMAFMTLISMGTGVFFGRLYDRLGEMVGVLSGFTIAGSFWLLASVDSIWKVYAALSLLGFGNALIMPYGYYHASRACPARAEKFCLALTQAAVSMGSFVSPFVVAYLKRLLSREDERFPFAASLAGMLIINLILVFYWHAMKKRGGKYEDTDGRILP